MTEATITCPFCGLACDDLAMRDGAVDTHGCPKAAAGFARRAAPRRPHAIAGRPVEFHEAAAAAAALLRAASAPLFYGLAADLNGIRALLALAERAGGTLDHARSPALLANASVARASGWVTATFGEVANRADFILFIGADPARNFPRFHERLVENAAPLYREGPPELAYIGPEDAAPPPAAAPLRAILGAEELLGALQMLAALTGGSAPRALPNSALATIAEKLTAARYGAIVWDAGSLVPGEAEYAVEILAGLLRRLNATTRCVGLPLGGSDGGLGVMQAALWQTGWPLPVGFGEGAPRHDPWSGDGRRLLDSGEADALVWVSALAADPPPPAKDARVPVIALVADDVDVKAPPAVEIRVGIPAIDHAGGIVRADTVIALKLTPSFPSDRPSVAEAARAILASMEAAP